MNLIATTKACLLTVIMLTVLPAHAQSPRFKPLTEADMTEAQRKDAR